MVRAGAPGLAADLVSRRVAVIVGNSQATEAAMLRADEVIE